MQQYGRQTTSASYDYVHQKMIGRFLEVIPDMRCSRALPASPGRKVAGE